MNTKTKISYDGSWIFFLLNNFWENEKTEKRKWKRDASELRYFSHNFSSLISILFISLYKLLPFLFSLFHLSLLALTFFFLFLFSPLLICLYQLLPFPLLSLFSFFNLSLSSLTFHCVSPFCYSLVVLDVFHLKALILLLLKLSNL